MKVRKSLFLYILSIFRGFKWNKVSYSTINHVLLVALHTGKDYKNDVRTLTFHCDRVPPGLALGKIMRWRNPHFHMFMDGRTGARIEDEDVANISIH